ncbi:MAG: YciI family protein [Chloroflexota bacterium]
MRVMVLIRATAEAEAGVLPGADLIAAMTAFNEDLAAAGVLVSGEGLKPTSHGARMRISGGGRSVERGPFPLEDGLVSGFWIWEVASLDDAIAWLMRCPQPMPGEALIEVRPLYEADDFGDEFTPDLREREDVLRRRLDG